MTVRGNRETESGRRENLLIVVDGTLVCHCSYSYFRSFRLRPFTFRAIDFVVIYGWRFELWTLFRDKQFLFLFFDIINLKDDKGLYKSYLYQIISNLTVGDGEIFMYKLIGDLICHYGFMTLCFS